jgi:uncharacterized protein
MAASGVNAPPIADPGRAQESLRENHVEDGNINWILAIASLLAGTGIGAAGHHLLGTAAGRVQQLRSRLAERERELTQLREHLTDHFAQVGTLVSHLQRETRALEHRLTEDAATLNCQPSSPRGLAIDEAAALEGRDDDIPAPRDYADGSGGTLSEDYGLKPAPQEAEGPQPPRY